MIDKNELIAALRAMQEAGIKVDDNVFNHAATDDLSGYEGISVEQLASMFCELYNWT